MLNKVLILVVLGALSFSQTAFAGEALIENSGTNPYKSVRITPKIAQSANIDLSDILVKDDKGENIPYFINYSSNETSFKSDNYKMTLINAYTKDDAFYFDYMVADLPESDVVATSINMITPNEGFAKNIILYGSYDNVNWEWIKQDKIYNVDGNIKLQVEFDLPQKFTHYRFMLENNLEKINFEAVYLNYSFEDTTEIYFEETLSAKFSVEEIDKHTKIYINGLLNLRIKDIEIETDSIFKRDAIIEELLVEKEIYNLSFDGTDYSQTLIEMPNKKNRDDTITITINNNDDNPINITAINVRYYADEIIFEDKGSDTFTLEFSSDNNISAPIYDIVFYKNEILKSDIDSLSIKEINIDEVEIAEEAFDFRLLYNIATIVVTLLLGVLILFKLKNKKQT